MDWNGLSALFMAALAGLTTMIGAIPVLLTGRKQKKTKKVPFAQGGQMTLYKSDKL